MAKTSLMEKLLAWGKFTVNLGKGTPVRDLPTESSDLNKEKVKDLRQLKEAIEASKKQNQAAREIVAATN